MKNIKFANKDKIERLKDIIRAGLNTHIDNDYVLLDVPNHSNIGDTLIWQGELEYLKELDYKCLYTSNIYTYNSKNISESAVILLHGGGNFGDVWRFNQNFRNKIIQDFPNNKIIIFPQTLHYSDAQNALYDAKLYANHPNLIICTRDNVSFEIAKKYFQRNQLLLLPDMAFFNDFTKFHTDTKTGNTLFLQRLDKELGDVVLLDKYLDKARFEDNRVVVRDWPGFYNKGTLKYKMNYWANVVETLGSKMLIDSPLSFLVDDAYGLHGRNYKNKRIRTGINFINQYDTVYSTRLHGFILAVLLNKEVFIFDNSYGKNRTFFDSWLSDFENVKLILE